MVSKGNVKKKNEQDKPLKVNIKEKFFEMLELPKDIVLNIPKITLVGTRDMMLENYKSIIEYDSARIRVNTGIGVIKITGSGLLIKEITSEDIIVYGEIRGVELAGM